MSEHNQQPFRSRDEELAHLGRQMADVREALREIAVRMNQIERHVKRSFGVSNLPGQTKSKGPRRPASGAPEQPTMSADEAISAFGDLVRTWKEQSPERVESRLQELGTPDLKLIAHELGLSFASKPSRKALGAGIVGRINESIMLSRNTNLTSPRSESTSPTPDTVPNQDNLRSGKGEAAQERVAARSERGEQEGGGG